MGAQTPSNQPGFSPGQLARIGGVPGIPPVVATTAFPVAPGRRISNREWVAALVRQRPGTTRAELMEETGLSRSTIKTVVAALVAESIIAEEGTGAEDRVGSGRRPALLFPVFPHLSVAAIRLGHDLVEVAIGDMLGHVTTLTQARVPLSTDPGQALDVAASLYDRALREHGDGPAVDAVVVALPGPIAADTGAVGSPSVLTPWSGLDLAQEMGQRLGREVHVENDANLAAWAERLTGAGRAYEDFIYLEVSRGVGAGLVLRGGVYAGFAGFAGEIGHNQVDPMGPLCRCGQHGCVEVMVSSTEILRRLRQVHDAPADDPRTVADFTDEVSARILRDAGTTLGAVVAATCNVLNPQAIVVGGDLLGAVPAYREGIAAAIARHTQPVVARGLVVVAGEVTNAPLVGALVRAGHIVIGHEYEAERRGAHLPRSSEHALVFRGPVPR